MALRIPIKLRFKDREVEVNALLNTGFETDEPVVALPLMIASKLGLSLGQKKFYIGPGRSIGEAFLAERVIITVRLEDIERSVEAYSVVEPKEEEVILSDKAISELGIVIDLKHNKWWLS